MAPLHAISTQVDLDSPEARPSSAKDALRADSPLESSFDETLSPTASACAMPSQSHNARSTDSSMGTLAKTKPAKQSYLFTNVEHPADFKSKTVMRRVRQHVMRDYLGKVASGHKPKPPTRAWISKRQRSTARSVSPDLSSTATTSLGQSTQLQDEEHSQQTPQSLLSQDNPQAGSGSEKRKPRIEPIQTTASSTSPWTLDHHLSVIIGRSPSPVSYLGSDLNPFGTSPSFRDPSLNTESLKWSCKNHFSTRALVATWLPTVVQARHAFLSTICISSAHDDIMRNGAMAPHERSRHDSLEQMTIRGEVMSLINQAMQDPRTKTADTTIVAVLHLLNSEIMGCDDRSMMTHQQGLHNLVRQRGGLANLGIEGQLASILTITMFLIAVLRESSPEWQYIDYARKIKTKPPSDARCIPESPVYSRLCGFHTINRVLAPSSKTFELLDICRLLTHAYRYESTTAAFYVSPLSPSTSRMTWNQDSAFDVQKLRERISSMKLEDEPHLSQVTDCARHTFEAIRLVAKVYAHALTREIPFSKAAVELSRSSGRAIHVTIRNSLSRTDLSDCWGSMAGVLFWIVLIAGACANPTSHHRKSNERASQEEDEAQRWLAAIAVRCSIVLSFQFGGAILETLKRMLNIEEALAAADNFKLAKLNAVQNSDASSAVAPLPDDLSNSVLQFDQPQRIPFRSHGERAMYGPQEPPGFQSKGLQDVPTNTLDQF